MRITFVIFAHTLWEYNKYTRKMSFGMSCKMTQLWARQSPTCFCIVLVTFCHFDVTRRPMHWYRAVRQPSSNYSVFFVNQILAICVHYKIPIHTIINEVRTLHWNWLKSFYWILLQRKHINLCPTMSGLYKIIWWVFNLHLVSATLIS